jgi:hypothetical protein
MLGGKANCQYGDDERDYNHDRADQGGPAGHSRVLAHPISKTRHTDPRWVNRPRSEPLLRRVREVIARVSRSVGQLGYLVEERPALSGALLVDACIPPVVDNRQLAGHTDVSWPPE